MIEQINLNQVKNSTITTNHQIDFYTQNVKPITELKRGATACLQVSGGTVARGDTNSNYFLLMDVGHRRGQRCPDQLVER